MYGYNDYRNYLAHYGVKGMKWGVRRYQDKNAYINSRTRSIQRDIDSFNKNRNNLIKSGLSNKEINDSIKGLEKVKSKREQKYSKKWDKKYNSAKTNKGKSIVEKYLNRTSGTKQEYINRKTTSIQKDIDSFNKNRTALSKSGLSNKEINDSIKGLEEIKKKREQKYSKKWDKKHN